jgi:hypothetical protein
MQARLGLVRQQFDMAQVREVENRLKLHWLPRNRPVLAPQLSGPSQGETASGIFRGPIHEFHASSRRSDPRETSTMRIDFLGLQALLSIAERGSFQRAAAHLNLLQTAVSHRMRKLEEESAQSNVISIRSVEAGWGTRGVTVDQVLGPGRRRVTRSNAAAGF